MPVYRLKSCCWYKDITESKNAIQGHLQALCSVALFGRLREPVTRHSWQGSRAKQNAARIAPDGLKG